MSIICFNQTEKTYRFNTAQKYPLPGASISDLTRISQMTMIYFILWISQFYMIMTKSKKNIYIDWH